MATLGLPGSAGVTEGTVADTIVVPYNDDAALDDAFARFGAELAAVIVEPIAANMGLVPPGRGFLERLRERCTAAGALLVFDEVITGFRLGPAGAQGVYGITPDLSMFGKVVGGGFPLAALGGRADVMDELAPLGPVYQAGTLSGNPVATAAGLAVLSPSTTTATSTSPSAPRGSPTACAARSPSTDTKAAGHAGRHARRAVLRRRAGHDYADAQAADHARYARFFHGMLDRGVFLRRAATRRCS